MMVGTAKAVNAERLAGIEAVNRLDEPEVRYLDEVVDRFGASAVAHRERAGERHEALDDLVAHGG